MTSTALISRFFTVEATPAGVEIPNIIGRGDPKVNSGYIEQIIVKPIAGGGDKISIEIRYDVGNPEENRLIYKMVDEPYSAATPMVDSRIRGPFSLFNVDTGPDMSLYIEPNATGILQVRIDMEMHLFI